MFIQVIRGRVNDKDGLKRQLDRWQSEVKPGATGHLGSTSGVADDGTSVAIVRFESEQAAQKNSDRPEQGAWWSETEKYFDGTPTFTNSSEVEEYLGGGSNDAGFVQVMIGKAKDKAKFKQWDNDHETDLKNLRPDLLGGLTIWDGDTFVQTAYFTSEADARKGEKNMEGDAAIGEWQALVAEMAFVDLKDPWLF
jgi:hypothetical protein